MGKLGFRVTLVFLSTLSIRGPHGFVDVFLLIFQ